MSSCYVKLSSLEYKEHGDEGLNVLELVFPAQVQCSPSSLGTCTDGCDV